MNLSDPKITTTAWLHCSIGKTMPQTIDEDLIEVLENTSLHDIETEISIIFRIRSREK